MRTALNVIQAILLIAMAPLVRGIIARIKAKFQNRQGASIFRPYRDLVKLFHKEDMAPHRIRGVPNCAPGDFCCPLRGITVHSSTP